MNFLKIGLIKNKLKILVLCLTISFSLCSAQEATKTEAVNQLKNFEQEILRLIKDFTDETSQKSIAEYTAEQYGEFSKILTICKDWFEFGKKLCVEITKLGQDLKNVLNPEKLCSQDEISEAKDFVKSYSEKLTQYQKTCNETLDFVKKRIKEDFPGNEQFLEGLEKGYKMSQEVLPTSISIAKKNAENINELLNFLSEKSGNYSVSNQTFIFQKSEDLEAYNKIADRLNKDKEEADAIVAKAKDIQQSIVKKLEATTKK